MPNGFKLFSLFTFLLLLAYSNTFHAAWQFDDKPNILANPRLQITELSSQHLWQCMHAKPGSGGLYRPIACLTLGINWFFGGNHVFGYHVVNFLIHLGTSWFLFLTICTLFATPRLKDRYPGEQIAFIAVTAALIWALNPIQTQAVTYIVQRMTSLAGFFSVVAIFCYLKARMAQKGRRQTQLMLLAVISYLFALFSKENAGLLPLVIPIIELLFFRYDSSAINFKKYFMGFGLYAFVCILAGLALRPEAIDFISNYYSNRPFTMMERFLTEQRILLLYFSLIFFPAPSRLSVAHDIDLSTSLFSPWTTAVAIIVNLLFILIAFKLRRKRPLLSLAILFFYINHIIESTIVPLELIFEHRNYLPSIFLFVPFAQLINSLLLKVKKRKAVAIAGLGLVSLIFMAEGSATFARNAVWNTEKSLWLDALAKAPNSSRPLATLAIKLAWGDHPTEGKYRKALQLIEKTLSMRMSRKRIDAAQLGNMASIHNKLGEYAQAIRYYQKALSIAPDEVSIRYNYAKALIMAGDFQQAKLEIESIVNTGFVHADYYNLLGLIDLWQGQPDRALPWLQKALKLAPGRPAILLALGSCMSEIGYYGRAQWFFQLAQKAGGEGLIVSLNLLQNALRSKDYLLAKKVFKHMLERYPLPTLFANIQPSTTQYKTVPLDIDILQPFMEANTESILKKLSAIKKRTEKHFFGKKEKCGKRMTCEPEKPTNFHG